MKRLCAALGILVLAACYSSPPPPPPGPQQPWVPTPPVYALIGERQELNLTSAQVTALDSIGVALHAQNSPKLMELRDMQPSGGFNRRPSVEAQTRARPMIDSIRENNRQAQEAVRVVLSEEQRTQVCRMFAPDRAEQRRREAAIRDERQRVPRGYRLPADTTLSVFSGPWTWCNQRGSVRADSTARASRPDSAARPAARPDTAARPRP